MNDNSSNQQNGNRQSQNGQQGDGGKSQPGAPNQAETSEPQPRQEQEKNPDMAGLEELGISLTLIESYAVGPYRYTNLADAIAQARRARSSGDRADGHSRVPCRTALAGSY